MKVKSKATGDILEARWIWGNWYAVIYHDESYVYQKVTFESCFEIISYE